MGVVFLEERVGFEPTDARTSPVFKTGSFNRSDISPSQRVVLYHIIFVLSTLFLKKIIFLIVDKKRKS